MKKIARILLSVTGMASLAVIGVLLVGAGYFKFKDVQAQHQAEGFCVSIPLGMDAEALKNRVQEIDKDADLTSFDEQSGASATWIVMPGRWRCDVALGEEGRVINKEVYSLD